MKKDQSKVTYRRLFWGAAGWFLPGLLMLASLFLSGCEDKNYAKVPEQPKSTELTREEKIKRGEYLVTTIGCADCNSPKQFGAQGPEAIKG